MDQQSDAWIDHELAGSSLGDSRLDKRLRSVIAALSGKTGATLPFACQDWAATKAAYRFFSNDRVEEAAILAGHFDATRERFDAAQGTILVLQDTTEFTFQRKNTDAVGVTYAVNSGKDKDGRYRMHTVCGLLMHSSLAVTTEGLPLGLAAVKFWNRQKFKGTAALKRKINPTRVPIEQKESFRWLENMRQSTALFAAPDRCVHIGDRESDIYELFCLSQELGTHFLVRTCVDRLAGEGDHTIADDMKATTIAGQHTVRVRTANGDMSTATVDVRYHRLRVLPPIGKQKRYPALTLTVLHATEQNTPIDRPKIDWKLLTDLPVDSHDDAVEKLRWYALRWKIEVFHKILKSGCRAEDARLRTADRLVRLIAVFCILSWRIFWMTMLLRANPEANPALALTEADREILDLLVAGGAHLAGKPRSLSHYLLKIARLGGYLARASDPPPGNIVIWRGLSRLNVSVR
ncbi:IS4 family transposase [Gluconacetobacter diazotrophicus]|uniref:IS4 family transposase n=1 Tax=Gluconacetobacter diazotrophicus TaxID=33996 RepID=UPI001C7EC89A|nr:IS4 family transposase [Gluconacetobacter diazotrophicus]